MTRQTFARPYNRTIGLDKATGMFALLGTVQVTLIATITVITVALPAIRRDLRIDDSGLVLVTAAYGLAFGGLLLPGGRLADRYGPRRVFAAGMSVFGAASVLAGLAPSAGTLLAARSAQGAGAALTAPAALALVGTVFPDPRRRGRAIALWGVLSGVGATAGNVLSGVLVTWFAWRWLFLGPLIVSAVAVAAAPALPSPAAAPGTGGRGEPGRIDLPGTALAVAGPALLIYGLQRSVWAAVAGLVFLAAFAVIERRSPAPLVRPALVAGRALPLLATALTAAAMAAAFFLLALYLQQVRGLSPLRTSALFALTTPPLMAAGAISARLVPRLGAHRVLGCGLAVAAAGLFLLGGLGVPYAGLLVFPLGAGLAFSGAAVAALAGVPDREAGAAGGLLNTAMELGPPVGIAALTAIAAAHSPDAAAGYAFALRAGAVAFLLTAPFALFRRGITE